jgi:type I restriction enzyme M protein
VVSLPAGCFNPYSGVKTSILILDKSLARAADTIAFFKVGNDGYGLGAQRRAIEKNDLPQVQIELAAYLQALRTKAPTESIFSLTSTAQIVPKEKLTATGDYNLSGERYREGVVSSTTYPLVPVGRFMKEGVKTVDPRTSPDEMFELWSIPAFDAGSPELLRGGEIGSQKKVVAPGDVLLSRIIPHIRRGWVVWENSDGRRQIASTEWIVFSSGEVVPGFLRQLLVSDFFHVSFMQTITGVGGSLSRANPGAVGEIKIPLPPLEVQKEIVAEIEGYQKVINGARAVLDHYRSHIPIHPDWPMVELSEICSFKNGLNFDKTSSGHTVKIIGVSDFQANLYAPLDDLDEVHLASTLGDDYLVKAGDILFVRSNGNPDLVGRSLFVPTPREPTTFSGFTIRGRIEDARALPLFFAHFFKSRDFAEMIKTVGQGANIRNLSQGILNGLKVPLPPLATQQAIVAEIEAEQALVAANRELITRFEQKIQATLARIWGEDESVPPEG